MPAQYLRDIADIMADRPVPDENLEAERIAGTWMRRPNQDVRSIEQWELPSGTVIAVRSPALRSHLKSARTVSRH